jgi:hypothetical protein
MKRIPKYIAVAALSLGVSSLFAQDDVYYNPNSNKGTTQPVADGLSKAVRNNYARTYTSIECNAIMTIKEMAIRLPMLVNILVQKMEVIIKYPIAIMKMIITLMTLVILVV